jgi:hypothetical protein
MTQLRDATPGITPVSGIGGWGSRGGMGYGTLDTIRNTIKTTQLG